MTSPASVERLMPFASRFLLMASWICWCATSRRSDAGGARAIPPLMKLKVCALSGPLSTCVGVEEQPAMQRQVRSSDGRKFIFMVGWAEFEFLVSQGSVAARTIQSGTGRSSGVWLAPAVGRPVCQPAIGQSGEHGTGQQDQDQREAIKERVAHNLIRVRFGLPADFFQLRHTLVHRCQELVQVSGGDPDLLRRRAIFQNVKRVMVGGGGGGAGVRG